MENLRLKAAFYRGGSSNAVLFNGCDLPDIRAARDRIFLHIMGSPDAYGRQLDGMGGGLSSVSKIVIVEPSTCEEADINYTFVQIAVDKPVADYGGMCGNMSAAVGPFAVDEGLVPGRDGPVTLRIRNTNTNKIFDAHFNVLNGRAVETGDFSIPGVSGIGAKIRLDFLDPGGAATGRLLPTGSALDQLHVEGIGAIDASMVDASNPVVFVRAADLGLQATETPTEIDGDLALMDRLERIRRAAAVAMGMCKTAQDAALSNPKIAVVGPAHRYTALDGRSYNQDDFTLSVRILSMGNCHRALTLTGALCVAVAAQIKGSLVHQLVPDVGEICIGNPSGVLPVSAQVSAGPNGPVAHSATAFRTQRRIMEGAVLFPSGLLKDPP